MGEKMPTAGATDTNFDDLVFGVLSAAPRRTVLRYLTACPGPVTVEELVSALAAEEVETALVVHSAAERDAIRITLEHVHLPKLRDAGLVEFETDRERVWLSPLGAKLARARLRPANPFDVTFQGLTAAR